LLFAQQAFFAISHGHSTHRTELVPSAFAGFLLRRLVCRWRERSKRGVHTGTEGRNSKGSSGGADTKRMRSLPSCPRAPSSAAMTEHGPPPWRDALRRVRLRGGGLGSRPRGTVALHRFSRGGTRSVASALGPATTASLPTAMTEHGPPLPAATRDRGPPPGTLRPRANP